MTKILAVANQKGGVGKTTTALNLAASLAVAERPVLLLDMDPQGNATTGSGAEIQNGRTIYHVLLGEEKLDAVIRPTPLPHLHVAPANGDLIGFEIEGLGLADREKRLWQAITYARDLPYEVVIMDCPPSLGLLTLNSLCAAQSVLVPLQGEYFAMEGLGRLLQTLDLVRRNLNPQLRLAGIVLTMFDKRNNLAHQVAAEVEQHFGEKLWQTRIPRNVKLSEAPSFGKPILLYDIRSPGAQAYLALADEYLQKEILGKEVSHDGETQSPGQGHRLAHP